MWRHSFALLGRHRLAARFLALAFATWGSTRLVWIAASEAEASPGCPGGHGSRRKILSASLLSWSALPVPGWAEDATLTKTQLQLRFNGTEAVAEKVLAEQQSQLGKPVSFEQRYIRTQRSLAQSVGKEAEGLQAEGESAMQGGNGPEDPLRTVVVNFKGAVQKIFITALQFESGADGNAWRGCEGPKVLLLSLQDAASGTNLTRAQLGHWSFMNHVLLVHPMLASSHRLSARVVRSLHETGEACAERCVLRCVAA
eukprot:Skav210067  [mRNA]  locus=scaffold485:138462:148322:+ [translate_table: standard]